MSALIPELPFNYYKELNEAARKFVKNGDTPAGLRGHIVNKHFDPRVLGWFGVARFDIDLAKKLHIPLDWVVKKAYDRIEIGWPAEQASELQRYLIKNPKTDVYARYAQLGIRFDEDWCKAMVIRNLRYIELLGLSPVDWNRVTRAVPSSRGITLDLARDSFDPFMKNPDSNFVESNSSKKLEFGIFKKNFKY